MREISYHEVRAEFNKLGIPEKQAQIGIDELKWVYETQISVPKDLLEILVGAVDV